MNVRRHALALLVAAALSGGASPAVADEAAALTGEIQTMDASATTKGSSVVTGKIAADFQSFAGSNSNSTALVTGLRSGSEITLTQPGEPSATFMPATKPMGYGNVSTSLALARYQLAQQGITNPTPTQLQTALNGGTIIANGTAVAYPGVLQMRADGMGWGQIAQQSGTKLGPLVSGIKTQNVHIATLPAARPVVTTTTTTGVATANGIGSSGAGKGSTGSSNAKGIVTAGGATPTANGNSANGTSTAGGSTSAPRGQGIVTAAGNGASPGAQGVAGGRSTGAVTAAGAGASTAGGGAGNNGNGKALGHVK
jgi:antitoxin (DNA-binding transcriptional repressor) of toxin-antitoxin stability system